MNIPTTAWLPLGLALVVGCDTPAGGRWPREGVADGRKANPPATVVTATNLRLQASVERDAYVVGEPVYLILRLENTGNQAQRVFGSLDPGDGAVEILVTGPDRREQRFVPLVETDQDSSIMVELAPAGSLGATRRWSAVGARRQRCCRSWPICGTATVWPRPSSARPA